MGVISNAEEHRGLHPLHFREVILNRDRQFHAMIFPAVGVSLVWLDAERSLCLLLVLRENANEDIHASAQDVMQHSLE